MGEGAAQDGQDLMKGVVNTFNVSFDPRWGALALQHVLRCPPPRPMPRCPVPACARRLLHTELGQSLGPLWREVEQAAKRNVLLPELDVVHELWKESGSNSKVFAKQMGRLQEAAGKKSGSGKIPRTV
mmetsp:Transcript_7947/g.22770  ORF Transcript_7947/g.22770 Transcript_7947/m.22770 type:complete len:128 (-) Transcript_7947:442-825(-)